MTVAFHSAPVFSRIDTMDGILLQNCQPRSGTPSSVHLRRPAVALVTATLALGGGDRNAAILSPHTVLASPYPSALTPSGRLLWRFEAFLQHTFGNRAVCIASQQQNTAWNFGAGSCHLSSSRRYRYVFSHPQAAPFYQVFGVVELERGSRAKVVLVNDSALFCDRNGRTVLLDDPSIGPLHLICAH